MASDFLPRGSVIKILEALEKEELRREAALAAAAARNASGKQRAPEGRLRQDAESTASGSKGGGTSGGTEQCIVSFLLC